MRQRGEQAFRQLNSPYLWTLLSRIIKLLQNRFEFLLNKNFGTWWRNDIECMEYLCNIRLMTSLYTLPWNLNWNWSGPFLDTANILQNVYPLLWSSFLMIWGSWSLKWWKYDLKHECHHLSYFIPHAKSFWNTPIHFQKIV